MVADKDIQQESIRAAGFRVCGDRAVRVDILERLADLIRPAVTYRPGVSPGEPPPGAADGEGFVVTVAMTSLAGCSGESFASILRSLGYASEHRKGPAIRVPLLAKGATAGPHAPQDTDHESGLAQALACGTDIPPNPEPKEPPIEARPDAEPPAAAALPVPQASPLACGSAPLEAMDEAASKVEARKAARLEPDAAGSANSGEVAADEEPLIEIWQQHRQQQHPRRPESRNRKKTFERRDKASFAGSAGAVPETAAPNVPPGETHAVEPPDSAETAKAALARQQPAPPPKPFKSRHKDAGERGAGEQRQRSGGYRGRTHAGGHNRGGMDEHGEGHGVQFGGKEKQRSERPPDPDSPFAKLLVLKALLEEQTRQGKDNKES